MRAGLDHNGRLVAWTHHLANGSRYAYGGASAEEAAGSEMYGQDFPARFVPHLRAVNRAGVGAQVEGGVTMGLSAALGEAVAVEEGVAVASNFGVGPEGYRLLRIDEAPEIEAHFVDSTKTAYGLGEPPLPPVVNAFFDATGRRLRRLPLGRTVA